MTREIRTGIDTGDHGAYRLYAECDSESTELLIFNPSAIGLYENIKSTWATSDWPKMLLEDHLGRCSACRDWAENRNN